MRARSPLRDVSAHHTFAATPLLFSTFKTYFFKIVGVGFSAYWAGHLSVPDLCGQSQRVPAFPAASLLGSCILRGNMHEEQRGGSSIPAVSGRVSQKHHFIIPRFNCTLTLVLSPAQNPKPHDTPPAPSHAPWAMQAQSSHCCTQRGFPPTHLLPNMKIPSLRSRCRCAAVSILSQLLVCPSAVLAFCLLLFGTPFSGRFGQPGSHPASFRLHLLPVGHGQAGERQNQDLAKRRFWLICFPSL